MVSHSGVGTWNFPELYLLGLAFVYVGTPEPGLSENFHPNSALCRPALHVSIPFPIYAEVLSRKPPAYSCNRRVPIPAWFTPCVSPPPRPPTSDLRNFSLFPEHPFQKGQLRLQSIEMSLVNLSHVCSHLNNATKARLSLTSIPNSNLHLKLCNALQNSGYISSVVRGGPTPPPAHPILGYPAANDEVEGIEPVTLDNVASRRLWLGLKYWRNESVLGKVKMVSKPTRRVTIDVEGLRRVVRGEDSGYVGGLRSPGESLFLSTDRGILEARECVEKKLGGLVLCRVL